MDNGIKTRTPFWVIVVLGISFLFLLSFHPADLPAPWFDEGWTLSVARNWAETGKYARLLNDVPISATGMAWNFTVTGPIALSFRLFGTGILQGRLPNILFTIVGAYLVYLLAKQMYNERIAIAAILLIVLGFPFPLVFGRQAIGEPAMLFYLLAGFYLFLLFLKRGYIFSILGSMLFWAAALTSKNQALPFWSASVLAIILAAGFRRDRFTLLASASVAVGTMITWWGMLWLQSHLEANLMLYGAPMKGLLNVTGWVPMWQVRIQALTSIALYAFPLVIGLGYMFFEERSRLRLQVNDDPTFYIRLAYWVLTISWLAWFVGGAMNWERYLYPATFLGNIFVANLLSKFTNDFKFYPFMPRGSEMVHAFPFSRAGVPVIASIVILCYMGCVVILTSTAMVLNSDAEKVAHYLNQATTPDGMVETYDSELLFLVHRRFNFPPDQIQVELNKRAFLGQRINIPYDPALANPDYLVVGPYSRMWNLYDSTLAQQNTWQLMFELPSYRVYKHNLQ